MIRYNVSGMASHMVKITVNSRLEQLKIVVNEEAPSWESVPHSSDS